MSTVNHPIATDPGVACPLCGAGMGTLYRLPHIWHLPEGTRPYRVDWCGRCGYGMLVPRPSPEELSTFYDPSYFTRYAGESAELYQGQGEEQPEPPTILDRVRLHLAWRLDRGRGIDADLIGAELGRGGAAICDIGCGNGDLLAALRDRGHRVAGVEIDPRAVDRARARGLEVHPGSAEDPPPAVGRGAFDAVAMTHVLEHCIDPRRAVDNAASLLRPGGLLFVEVPNQESIVGGRSGPCWFYGDAGRHVNFFTAGSLAATARAAGLVPARTLFSGYCAAFANDRVAAEGSVYDLLYGGAKAAAAAADGARRSSRARLWGTLARSLFAPPPRKYEVVGLVARRDA